MTDRHDDVGVHQQNLAKPQASVDRGSILE